MKLNKILNKPSLLTLLLLLPAFTDLFRKIMPGQPNLVTPLLSSFFSIFCFYYFKKKNPRSPLLLKPPIVALISFQVIYIFIALLHSYKVGIAAFYLRFVPFLLPFTCYRAISNFEELKKTSNWLILFLMLLFPIALYSIFFGNDSLPALLKPIELIQEQSKDKRGGYDICSAIFSTGATMAFSVFGYYILLLSVALSDNKRKWIYHIGAILALFVMYSTVRRSTLYFGIICFLSYVYLSSKKGLLYIVALSIVLFVLSLVSPDLPSDTGPAKKGIIERFGIFFDGINDAGDRVNNIVFGVTKFWFDKKPFGTYLGYAGRESLLDNVPRSNDLGPVEIGMAQLIAETGFIGLIVFVVAFFWMWYYILKYGLKSKYYETIQMLFVGNICILLMYLLQMVTMLFGMYIAQIVFWSSPGIAWALIKKC